MSCDLRWGQPALSRASCQLTAAWRYRRSKVTESCRRDVNQESRHEDQLTAPLGPVGSLWSHRFSCGSPEEGEAPGVQLVEMLVEEEEEEECKWPPPPPGGCWFWFRSDVHSCRRLFTAVWPVTSWWCVRGFNSSRDPDVYPVYIWPRPLSRSHSKRLPRRPPAAAAAFTLVSVVELTWRVMWRLFLNRIVNKVMDGTWRPLAVAAVRSASSRLQRWPHPARLRLAERPAALLKGIAVEVERWDGSWRAAGDLAPGTRDGEFCWSRTFH